MPTQSRHNPARNDLGEANETLIGPAPLCRRLLLVAALILVVCAALPAMIPLLVIWRADDAAGGRPYCIQVAHGHFGYRAATSLQDFLGYTMRAWRDKRRYYTSFHAVLFAERPRAKVVTWGEPRYERFNWSFRQLRFVPIIGQGHAALGDSPGCIPVPGFVGALPL